MFPAASTATRCALWNEAAEAGPPSPTVSEIGKPTPSSIPAMRLMMPVVPSTLRSR